MEKAKNKWDGSTNSTVGESLPLCIEFVGEKQGWVEFLKIEELEMIWLAEEEDENSNRAHNRFLVPHEIAVHSPIGSVQYRSHVAGAIESMGGCQE